IVLGDARRMPFKDREFDIALALDLLEHVPPADRREVLSELARVASRRVIVGCPTGRLAMETDRSLRAGLRASGSAGPAWREHPVELGFPAPQALAAGLASLGEVQLLGIERLSAPRRILGLHWRLGWFAPLQSTVAALRRGCVRGSTWSSRLLWLL